MNKIILTADSTSDFPRKMSEGQNVILINQHVFLGDNGYTDGIDISPEDIFNFVQRTDRLPTTSCPSPIEYAKAWAPIVGDGDSVLHFNLSDCLGANYQNAVAAAKEFKNVFVIDSRTATSGIAMLIFFALDEIKKNPAIRTEELYNLILQKRENVHCSLLLEKLTYMHKGGRCSQLALIATNFFKIRVEIRTVDGKLTVKNKFRGNMRHAVRGMLRRLDDKLKRADKKRIMVGQTGNENAAGEFLFNHISENYKFENIIRYVAGSVITSHGGDGAVALGFLSE
jgi:DegV family protein with EDD domain